MAPSLKKYVAVGFFSEQEAQQALSVALAQFRKGCSTSDDLSHCEGNIVYLCAESKHEEKFMKSFLLHQPGAQPDGCYCKV